MGNIGINGSVPIILNNMFNFYVVATPIGNLADITFRAVLTLKSVDLILCEDTRVAKILLDHYDIKTPRESYHARSTPGKIQAILDKVGEGKTMAMITDAGTPGISDPGSVLVAKIKERFGEKVKIIPIPGASALTTALSISGAHVSAFVFLGFLPHKKGRETLFREISDANRAYVFYESKHRVMKTLESLLLFCPDKKVFIARELTKIYEDVLVGSPKELLDYFSDNPDKIKGEFVLIVDAA